MCVCLCCCVEIGTNRKFKVIYSERIKTITSLIMIFVRVRVRVLLIKTSNLFDLMKKKIFEDFSNNAQFKMVSFCHQGIAIFSIGL